MGEPVPDQIAELVASADRSRSVSPVERERILARMGTIAPVAQHEIRTAPHARRPTARRQRWRPVMVAGAVAVTVLGLAILVAVRVPGRNDPATEPVLAPTTPVLLAEACAGSLPPLSASVAAWGSLSDWAYSDGGVPDVGTPLVRVLRDLSALSSEMASQADALEQAIDGLPDQRSSPSRAEWIELDRVSHAAVADLLALIERHDLEQVCDVKAIEDAVR